MVLVVWFRKLVVVTFGKAEVRKRLRIPVPVADVASVPEATSVSYLKRLAPRQTTAAGEVAVEFLFLLLKVKLGRNPSRLV
jgi:hypothetical protein